MPFQLLGNEVVFGDGELFGVRIAVHIDDLHPVQQGARDGRGGVGRRDEENIGQDTILEIEHRFNERGAKYGENGNVTGAVARRILETAL